MIRQDRFFLAILAGIAALVVLSLALFFARQGAPAYIDADTPQAAVQNYLTALSQKDYARAFGYVAGPPAFNQDQAPGLPDAVHFRQFFIREAVNQLGNVGLQIGETGSIDDSQASVAVTLLHTSGELFSSVGREYQQFQLIRQGGGWKITQGPYPFWNYAWSGPNYAKPIPAPPVSP